MKTLCLTIGLLRRYKPVIDQPINEETTYSDILCFLSSKIKTKINYLEIGVSVGKNFLQLANYLDQASLTGFELEEINPTLEGFFINKHLEETWETIPDSKKKQPSSLTSYQYNNNAIQYLSGDVFDENSWKRLAGNKFNLLFSDAFHSPKALEFEYRMLKKYDLMDQDNFVFLWDDLGGEMTLEFMKIAKDICKNSHLGLENIVLNRYRGWFGQHEHRHLNGVISKLS